MAKKPYSISVCMDDECKEKTIHRIITTTQHIKSRYFVNTGVKISLCFIYKSEKALSTNSVVYKGICTSNIHHKNNLLFNVFSSLIL